MDEKDAKKLVMKEAEYAMRWYGWGSPIGLSIFFLALALIAVLIKIAFFG